MIFLTLLFHFNPTLRFLLLFSPPLIFDFISFLNSPFHFSTPLFSFYFEIQDFILSYPHFLMFSFFPFFNLNFNFYFPFFSLQFHFFSLPVFSMLSIYFTSFLFFFLVCCFYFRLSLHTFPNHFFGLEFSLLKPFCSVFFLRSRFVPSVPRGPRSRHCSFPNPKSKSQIQIPNPPAPS